MPRRPSHDQLIHCESCGEDYSATYRKCPFCGARNAPRRVTPDPEPEYAEPAQDEAAKEEEEYDDGYVFDGQDLFDDEPEEEYVPPKGGKRLAGGNRMAKPKGGGDKEPRPAGEINLPRLITFLCSLVIIVAALVIVFTIVYPQLHKNKDKDKNPASSQSPAVSEPSEPSGQPSQPAAPSGQPSESGEPGGEASEAPSGAPSEAPSQPVAGSQPPAAGETTLKDFTPSRTPDKGFTLNENESYQVTLTFDPAGWSGDVTWSISDTRYATVSDNGTVTNVNKDAKLHGVYLTVTAGGISKEIPVYCKASSNPVSSEPPAASSAPSGGSGGSVATGKEGTIVDAEEGLRVRSGPGTTYDVLASLKNGDTVQVVKDAGDGWYEITFHGAGGQDTTGYIMGDYISTD